MNDNCSAAMREEGYYWILPEEGGEWIIGYWYEGHVDILDKKSRGYFDCSNHWNTDYERIYSPCEVGKKIIKGLR